MKFVFVMDPLLDVNIDGDTSFALMLAAQNRGHEIYYVPMENLFAAGNAAFADAYPCTVKRAAPPATLADVERINLSNADAIFMRKDPPFDIAYLHACHLLELAEKQGALVVNKPSGLRGANEKLYALNFHTHCPETIVTRHADDIFAFAKAHDGQCVVKPIDGHGGAGAFLVHIDDRNAKAIVETSTREGRERVICQAYVKEARLGDKRILMLDGKPLGGLMRIPQGDDNRGNMHVGGSVAKTELTATDLEICEAVAPSLIRDGLWFVGIDVLGDKLTEVNVTSPTGIQEMSRFDDVDYSDQTIAWAEAKIQTLR